MASCCACIIYIYINNWFRLGDGIGYISLFPLKPINQTIKQTNNQSNQIKSNQIKSNHQTYVSTCTRMYVKQFKSIWWIHWYTKSHIDLYPIYGIFAHLSHQMGNSRKWATTFNIRKRWEKPIQLAGLLHNHLKKIQEFSVTILLLLSTLNQHRSETCGDSPGCSWLKQPHCHSCSFAPLWGKSFLIPWSGEGKDHLQIPGEHFHIIPNSLESVPLGMSCRLPDKRMTRINLAHVSIYPTSVILYQVSIHLWKMLSIYYYYWLFIDGLSTISIWVRSTSQDNVANEGLDVGIPY